MITKALTQFKEKLFKRRVYKRYLKHFETQLQTEFLNEKWIIECIVARGQTSRREELSKKQSEIRELQLLIEFFKKNG
jgi:hypothetical protein